MKRSSSESHNARINGRVVREFGIANEVLKVFLWGQEIGRLAWHDARKTSFFMYNPEFLKGTLDIAPLAASIHNPLSTRAIFGEAERIYQKLPSFIADSLPDAWGNLLFEQWRKDNRLTERNVTSIEKLAFIGKRGMGALEFVPEIKRSSMTGQIDIKTLADLAEKIAVERENVKILPDESLTLQSLIAVGTSAGGRQPKGIIAIDRKTGVIRSGQIDVEPNLDYYILKFGDRSRSTAELEQAYYEMAVSAGINMMASRLLEVDGVNHFLTKRFDRKESGKLHTQTLAAMDPEADSYEKLFAVCRKLHLPEVDCQELYRRMVFNILANNTDDHHKNFTFVMDRQGTWRLSPAYDMTYIFDTGGYLPNREHCLMIGGKLQDITREDAVQFARDNGIRRPDAIIRDVVESLKQFRAIAAKYGVSEQWSGRVEATIIDHLKAWGEWQEDAAMQELTINGHLVSYRRTRRLSMRIVKNGDVHVSAPIGMPKKKVERFIEEHREWIAEARKKTFESQKRRADFYNKLPLKTREQSDDALRRLKTLIEPMVDRHSTEMGVKPSAVYYKAMISRWGVCNVKDRSICFSAYLLLLQEWCVEHVVVHELCHLLEPSHNARFHALMDKFYPRWKEARKETRKICKMEEDEDE